MTRQNDTVAITNKQTKKKYIRMVSRNNWRALTLSAPNFRPHLSSSLFLNKLSIGKKLICKYVYECQTA